ncbi:MAG TPA: hypothetical protein VF595_10285 [Tepidisphaeraceae bacterium]|jgi:hypothetical protein
MRRWTVVSLLLMTAVARAQDVPLGPRFTGPFDVSFKPFVDAKQVERQSTGEIVRMARADKNWLLTFSRAELGDASPLKDSRRADGQVQAGYLSTAINKLRSSDPATDVLRNEIIELGDMRIGVLAALTHEQNKPVLLQQALMEITPTLYYTLVMICPIEGNDAHKSPAAREAGAVFKGVLDSIERVDLSALKQDQDQRLFRTRGLFAQWNANKLSSVLVPERYLRYKRDGRDVGYAYIVEQPASALPRKDRPETPVDPATASGLRVGTRSRTLAEGGKVLDVESWMYVSHDRRHEVWSKLTVLNDPAGRTEKEKANWFSEVGASDLNREREFDRNLTHDDLKEADQKSKTDPKAQAFREVDRYRLLVRNEGRSAVAQPLERVLPPFYLPQAMTAMLPRLVPLDNPTGYLFAVFNSESRQVMMRYVDVSPEQDVKLDGRVERAVGVSERLGTGGSVTTHYFGSKGAYLGSVNNDSKLEILPTDAETLRALWKDANLKAPEATK